MLNFLCITMVLKLSRRVTFSQEKLIFKYSVIMSATYFKMVQKKSYICTNICVGSNMFFKNGYNNFYYVDSELS